MKTRNVLIVVICMFAAIFSAQADNDKPITFDLLPQTSKVFIMKYFSEKDISYAKIDKEFFSKSYEVFFVNGSKVEFKKDGTWKEIDCLKNQIPAGIVPGKITDYVKSNHPASKIVKIERNKKNYEIELDNDLEIKFDLAFNVIGYDE